MNTNKNKFLSVIIVAILLASISAFAGIAVPVKAQATPNIPPNVTLGTPQIPTTGGPIPAGVTANENIVTLPWLSFSPNPIGVGQSLLVNVWTQPALQVNRGHTGYTVVITDTDTGTSETVGPFVSFQADTTAYFNWIPTVAGNYTLQFFFAGDYYPAGYYFQGLLTNTSQSNSIVVSAGTTLNAGFNATTSCYYEPSNTLAYPLVVQQNFVNSWQPSPLPGPGQYWTRPINPDNREWYVIGGNDPNNEMSPGITDTNMYASQTTAYEFTPFASAPNSAHVVWRMAGIGNDGLFGGLIDGASTVYQAPDQDASGAAFTFGQSGPGFGGNPSIVFEGRCYQTTTAVMPETINGSVVNEPVSVWECYDLQTGTIYWRQTGITQPPTQITFSENTMPVPGGSARTDRTVASLLYLGSGRIIKYNPVTGAVTSNQTIPTFSSSILYADPYILSIQSIGTSSAPNYRLINWTLSGVGNNFTASIDSNITWPFASLGSVDFESNIAAQAITMGTSTATGLGTTVYVGAASILTGALLWNVSAGVGYPIFSGLTGLADHGMYAQRFDNGFWYCWNLQNGNLVWKSQLDSIPWGTFGAYGQADAYGNIYYGQYDGVVAYSWATGQVAWHFEAPCLPFETPYLTNGVGNPSNSTQGYSFFSQGIVADGKCYFYSVEHSPTAPLSRGWSLFCINATTGAEIWSTIGPMIPGVVSDGYLTATNYYDNYMYVFGMGQSSLSVTAPVDQITVGQTVTVTGKILDNSPASSQTAEYAPGTVPCVSDACMGEWESYLFQQAPLPTNLTGVPITISVVGPNCVETPVNTVTSDPLTGAYGSAWTPTTAGTYTIYASYPGSYSYSFSTAATVVVVTAAPTATPTVTPTPTPVPTNTSTASNVNTNTLAMYLALGVIAIIIAIAIVGLLILRKK